MLAFDAVSFNVGSEVRTPAALDGVAGIWPVKVWAGLLALRRHLEAVFAAERRCPALVVAGGARPDTKSPRRWPGSSGRHRAAADAGGAGRACNGPREQPWRGSRHCSPDAASPSFPTASPTSQTDGAGWRQAAR